MNNGKVKSKVTKRWMISYSSFLKFPPLACQNYLWKIKVVDSKQKHFWDWQTKKLKRHENGTLKAMFSFGRNSIRSTHTLLTTAFWMEVVCWGVAPQLFYPHVFPRQWWQHPNCRRTTRWTQSNVILQKNNHFIVQQHSWTKRVQTN